MQTLNPQPLTLNPQLTTHTPHSSVLSPAFLHDARGQSTIATFPFVALLLLLLLGFGAFVVKVRPAQVAVAAAAQACVRVATTSLDQEQGLAQGVSAGMANLQAHHLDPERATVDVAALGPWDRLARVECRVTYRVGLQNIAFAALFAPEPEQHLSATYALDVDTYTSRWGGAP